MYRKALGSKMRIAIEGCGHGTLHAIYASVKKSCKLNNWDGIDLLIIGGDFQAVRNSYDLNSMSVPLKYREIGDFHEYYSGVRKAPVLTIFVGGNHEASSHLWELYYGGWVAPNIYYLGAANVIRFGPLRIAGLSGIWKGYNYKKPHHERLPYNQNDVKSIYHVRELDVRKLLQIRTQIDIGISHDWPRGVEWMGNWKALFAKKNHFEADAKAGTLGSAAAKTVMDRLRPSHWFSAHLHCKFAAVVQHEKKIDHNSQGASESLGTGSGAQSQINDTVTKNVDPEWTGDVPSLHFAPEKSIQSRNDDEIDLDMEDEDDSPIQSSIIANSTSQESGMEPGTQTDPIPASIRAQLPASFNQSVSQPAFSIYSAPSDIINKTTNFLALDKCLPNRKFLQFLSIDSISRPASSLASTPEPLNQLSYDKEWLAITRVFASELVLGDPSSLVPRDKGEAHYLPLILAEEKWVEENIEKKGLDRIPQNFEITAPTYDPAVDIRTNEQPKEYTNPQTVAFCELVGIENRFMASEESRAERRRQGPKLEETRNEGDRGRGSGRYRGGGRGRWRGGGRGGRVRSM